MAERGQDPAPGKTPVLPWRAKGNVRRPGAVTALEIDSAHLRIAQASPRGNRTVITRVEVAPLPFPSDADKNDATVVGAAIARALEDLRLKPGPVVIGVPRHSVILRTLILPAIEDVRELASMVHMQIGKDLPFRADEAVIDFTARQAPAASAPANGADEEKLPAGGTPITPSADASKIEVLVAAARRETVDYYQKVAAAAGVKLVALGWLSPANARCMVACQALPEKGAVALVTLRPEEVGIDILAEGSLIFSRGAAIKIISDAAGVGSGPKESVEKPAEPPLIEPSASSGPQTFNDAALIEVIRSLHSYGGVEVQTAITQLIVAGSTGHEADFIAKLQERLSIPCLRLEPVTALGLPSDSAQAAADAVGAMGLGLGVNDPDGLPFDFLNPKKPAVQRNTRRLVMLAGAAAGTVLLVGLLGLRTHLINQRNKIKKAVDAELIEAQKKSSIYRQMQQQAAVVQNWAKEGRTWLDHYAYLSSVLPASEDVYITSLSISGQGNVHLAVQARSGEILANLDRQLRAAGYDVKPLAITPGNDKFGYNFRSTVELIVPPKMKMELAKAQVVARPADDASLDWKARSTPKGGRK